MTIKTLFVSTNVMIKTTDKTCRNTPPAVMPDIIGG